MTFTPINGRPRDVQRQHLYDAERVIPAWADPAMKLPTVPEMQSFIDGVLAGRWLRSRWGLVHIEVRAGQGHRRAVSYGPVLHMPKWSRSRLVLLHELAHSLTPHHFASHGPQFAGVFIALVERSMGKSTAADLRMAFRVKRVRWNREAIPEPRRARSLAG